MSLHQLVAILVCLLCGISIGYLPQASFLLVYFFFCLSALSFAGSIFIIKRKIIFAAYRLNIVAACSLFCGIGIFSALNGRPSQSVWQSGTYLFSGKVTDYVPTNNGDRVEIRLSYLRPESSKGLSYSELYNVNALITVSDQANLSYGNIISGRGNFKSLDEPANFLDDGYKDYLRKKNIYLTGYASDGSVSVNNTGFSIQTWFKKLRYNIEVLIEKSSLTQNSRNFIISILLGDKTYMKKEDRLVFSDAGISHIFAVSGLHVSLIGGFILAVLSIFFIGSNRRWKFLLAVATVWFYILLVGASPATCRAGLMFTIAMLGLFMQRKNFAGRALISAVILILAFDSTAVFDIGFQLSIICVGTLIFIATPLNFIDRRLNPRLHWLVSLILVTLCAVFSSWLICAFYFHRFSLMFLPLNIIAVPMLPMFLILCLIYIFSFAIGINILPLAKAIDWLYTGFESLAEWSNSATIPINNLHPSGISVFLWIAGLIALSIFLYQNKIKRRFVLVPIALFFASIISIPSLSTVNPTGFIIQRNSAELSIVSYDHSGEQIHSLPSNSNSVAEISGKRIVSLVIDELGEGFEDYLIDADVILISGQYSKLENIVSHLKEGCFIVTHSSIHWAREKKLLEIGESLACHIHSLRYDGPLHLFD